MADEPLPVSPEDLAKLLAKAGVPQSVFFYVVLGVISGARKLLIKAVETGCPPGDTNCVDFTSVQPGTDLKSPVQRGTFIFTSLDNRPLHIIGWGLPTGQSKLLIYTGGIEIRLPYPADQVIVRGAQYTKQPLVLSAFNNDQQIDQVTAPVVENILHKLKVKGTDITHVVLTGGGNEGLLFDVCIPKQETPPIS